MDGDIDATGILFTYNADNMSMYNPNGGLPKTILIDVAKIISEKT